MPYPAKHISLQKAYDEPFANVLAKVLTAGGYDGAHEQLGLAKSTINDYMHLFGVKHESVYLAPGQRIVVVDDITAQPTHSEDR